MGEKIEICMGIAYTTPRNQGVRVELNKAECRGSFVDLVRAFLYNGTVIDASEENRNLLKGIDLKFNHYLERKAADCDDEGYIYYYNKESLMSASIEDKIFPHFNVEEDDRISILIYIIEVSPGSGRLLEKFHGPLKLRKPR